VPTARRKQLTRTAYDPAYRRAWARQQSRQGQAMRRKRQSSVEPVFGNLIHHYGLCRVGSCGKASAQKTRLMAAIAYTLKKLLQHPPRKDRTMALVFPPPPATPLFGLRTRRIRGELKMQLEISPQEGRSSATATAVSLCLNQLVRNERL